MKWSSVITFPHPPRAVSLRTPRSASAADDGSVSAAVWREKEAEWARREEQAYERGLLDGERRLGELLMQQRSEIQHLHSGVLESLRKSVAEVLRESEETLVDLAFEVARKLVAEVPVAREQVEANVRAAMAEAKDATEFLVHLHPDDLDLLQRHASELLAPETAPPNTRFVGASDVDRGGCVVRTEFGAIDARRETRLARVRRALDA